MHMRHTQSVELAGSWELSEEGTQEWMPAVVPGTVLASLHQNGRIEDPYVGTNNHKSVWVEKRSWRYRTHFAVPADWSDDRLLLAFDGVDYEAEVFLNGVQIGRHVGMFGGPEIEISELAERDRENVLELLFSPPPVEWRGVFKASVLYGWHYGRTVSTGPWRAVNLIGFRKTRIDSAVIRTTSVEAEKAVLHGEVRLSEPLPAGATARVAICGVGFEFATETSIPAAADPAVRAQSRAEFSISVANPKLWWPFDLGEQPLYRAVVSVFAAGSPASKPDDEVSFTFGIRSFSWHPTETKKEGEYDWILAVNGRQHFIKGTNWSFPDSLLRLTKERYGYHLAAARAAGINLLRVWGGGIVETEEFYDLCDELGIMVWQEFPLTHPLSTDTSHPPGMSLEVVGEQSQRIVKQLRNRASLLLWCGGNEHRGKGNVIDAIEEICGELDPTRIFHRACPDGGDIHDWDVYHHRYAPLSSYTKYDGPFASEFGLPCPPAMKSIAAFTPAGERNGWPPRTGGSFIHHMPEYGSSPGLLKMLRYAMEYGDVLTTEQFVRYSQLAQAHAFQIGIDHARTGMLRRTGGVAFYKLNESSPGHSWAAVDWYGRPKPSYYFVKRAYEPVRAIAPYRHGTFFPDERLEQELYVANDGPRLQGATLAAELMTTEFAAIDRAEHPVSVDENSALQVATIDRTVPVDEQGRAVPFFLLLTLAGADGERLSRSVYWFNHTNIGAAALMSFRPVFDDLAWRVGCLDRLPVTTLELQAGVAPATSATAPGGGGRRLPPRHWQPAGPSFSLSITNSGPVPAFLTELDTTEETVALFSDGAFWLDPGERRLITGVLHPSARERLSVEVIARAWNAPETESVACPIQRDE